MGAGNISTIATYCAVSAALTAAICFQARTFGRAAQLIDKPDGARKLHGSETPLIGGLAVLVPSFIVSMIYLVRICNAPFLVTAIVASTLMLVVGLIDDRSGISPAWRLLVMMFIVFITMSVEPLFVLHTLRLEAFASNISAISLDPIAAPITVIFVLGFANASNMADGMNGQLLGSIIIWSTFVAYHLGAQFCLPFIVIICSSLVAISFNLRGKLFSGGAGAYAATLFVALGAIAAYHRSRGNIPAEVPLFWFWLPVVDCLRLMIIRPLTGKSPLAGDRNHFHHMLQEFFRMPYALIAYLALLAAPGMAAEIRTDFGTVVLAICMCGYTAFIVFRQVRVSRARGLQTILGATPPVASALPSLTPSARGQMFRAAQVLQTEAALQQLPRQVGSSARM